MLNLKGSKYIEVRNDNSTAISLAKKCSDKSGKRAHRLEVSFRSRLSLLKTSQLAQMPDIRAELLYPNKISLENEVRVFSLKAWICRIEFSISPLRWMLNEIQPQCL